MSSRRWTVAIHAGLAVGICACADTAPPNQVQKTIGPGGGLISSHDQVLSIVLLPGALASELQIEIFPSDAPPPIFGLAYRVRPDIDLLVSAEVTYRRVLPNNANAATVGVIRLDDYGDEMGHWVPLPRLALNPEQQSVISVDDRLSLYYGLLEDADAPPLPTAGTNGTPPPTTGEGTTTSGPETEASTGGSTEGGTTSGEPPPTSDGPGSTSMGSAETSTGGEESTDEGGEMGSTDDGGPVPICGDGMPLAGELCLVEGAVYPAGLGPIDIVVGNFDGDPAIDVLTLDAGALEIGLLPGNGDGTLQASALAVALGGVPVELAVGDFNGDGGVDVVVLDTAANTVGLFIGDGAGGFAAPIDTVAGLGSVDLAAADFNGDMSLDLSVLNTTDQTLQLLLGGPGGMTLGGTGAIGAGIDLAVANADYSGDGVDDTMGLGAGGFDAWATDGTGAGFIGEITGPFGGGGAFVELVAGDINGDGNTDVLAIDGAAGQLVIGLSTGAPATYNFQPPLAVGIDPSDIVVAELDGDGPAEVVVCNAGSDDVMIFDWNGAALALAFTFDAGTAPSGVAVAQLDGDGVPDLLVSAQGSDTVTVILSDP